MSAASNAGIPNMPKKKRLRIVAPVNCPEDVGILADAGVDEIYCGVLPLDWSSKYGAWDSLSRRQGNIANLSSLDELRVVARSARNLGIPSSLALNVRYTSAQIPQVLDLAQSWEQAGGASVIVSGPEILLGLQRRGSRLFRHISLLANVMNSSGVAFFRRFGADRIILPRDLTLNEMGAVISRYPDVEYEVMALNEKCRFMDGLCGFYHGTQYPDDAASVFPYEHAGQGGIPTVYSHDPCYAGHGCQVPFTDEQGNPGSQPHRDDASRPACAACSLARMLRAGVGFLKIGGRGFPTELKLRSVSYLRAVRELAERDAGAWEIRELYRNVFGRACDPSSCYYRESKKAGDREWKRLIGFAQGL